MGSSKGTIWGDARLWLLASFLVAETLVLVEGATLSSGEISREGLRRLEEQEEVRQEEDLNKMKIMLTSRDEQGEMVGGGPRGGEEEDDEVQLVPKTLEAAQLLLEKYKEERRDDGGISGEEEPAMQQQQHHHHRRPLSISLERDVQEAPQREPSVIMQMGRAQNGRALWSQDFDRKTSELCGTSASLLCGKRILSLIEGQEMGELSVHMKCDLRDDFLQCIDTQKRDCLELTAKSAVLPQLPPKEAIKLERAKLWKVLWTAGGCVLAD